MTNQEIRDAVKAIQDTATAEQDTVLEAALAAPPQTIPDAAQQAILNAVALLQALLQPPPTP